MVVARLTVEVVPPQSDVAVSIRICACNQIEIEAQRIAETDIHQSKSKPTPELRPMTAWELD